MNFFCPFHKDINASLNIKKNFFLCYGCKKYGKIKNIVLPEKKFDFIFNKELIFQAKKNLYYKKNLWLNYLIKRNINFSTSLKYNLGCIDFLFKKKYNFKIFKNKLIFPIINENNIICGIGLKTKNNFPKYINFFKKNVSKNNILYGLNEKNNNILSIVVEGYFDMLTLNNFNINNSISLLGNNVSLNQLFLLKKNFKNIFFCLDGDFSGYQSVIKINKLKKKFLLKNIKIKNLPLHYDPDNFINKFGIKNFLIFLKK